MVVKKTMLLLQMFTVFVILIKLIIVDIIFDMIGLHCKYL